MEKVMVLNSGGFDSVVLMNDICQSNIHAVEVVPVYFRHGAVNTDITLDKAVAVSDKYGCDLIIVDLPEFEWTKGEYYTPDTSEDKINSKYLEYRNLVFFSYAVSIAQSLGIKEIFTAIDSNAHIDTSEVFMAGFNLAIQKSGITVCAPYIDLMMESMFDLARMLEVSPDDFHSCDMSEKEPCLKCADCSKMIGYKEYLRRY